MQGIKVTAKHQEKVLVSTSNSQAEQCEWLQNAQKVCDITSV